MEIEGGPVVSNRSRLCRAAGPSRGDFQASHSRPPTYPLETRSPSSAKRSRERIDTPALPEAIHREPPNTSSRAFIFIISPLRLTAE
jgi:hypothetical protein